MPKEIRHQEPNDQQSESENLFGFQWDGTRFVDFLRFHPADFCYIHQNRAMITGHHVVHVGDWVIHEAGETLFMSDEEFREEFEFVT